MAHPVPVVRTGCTAVKPPAAGWCSCYQPENPAEVQVHPLGDAYQHDLTGDGTDCFCGPTVEPVPRADGSNGWIVIHHSLDGREQAA